MNSVANFDIKAQLSRPTRKRHNARFWTAATAVLCVIAIVAGWGIRDEYLINAERGIGYALGVIGGGFMLALLIYPIRKRYPTAPAFVLSTPTWFKLHMLLGLIGPILILYHSNFGLGSTNANIALFSMLLMVTSGLVGRFIYSKIHMGLYGSKAHFAALIKDQDQLSQSLLDLSLTMNSRELASSIKDHLQSVKATLVEQKVSNNPLVVAARNAHLTRAHRALTKQIKLLTRDQTGEIEASLGLVQNYVSEFFYTSRKINGLAFYDRLFSIWHMLHLPIFFMLIIAGFVHVYAVHTY
ncbi:MAG: hypothetical protein P8O79_03185 [Halieaceae bacterium]|nr:hypothetical protein [Halieaceae bacterium]